MASIGRSLCRISRHPRFLASAGNSFCIGTAGLRTVTRGVQCGQMQVKARYSTAGNSQAQAQEVENEVNEEATFEGQAEQKPVTSPSDSSKTAAETTEQQVAPENTDAASANADRTIAADEAPTQTAEEMIAHDQEAQVVESANETIERHFAASEEAAAIESAVESSTIDATNDISATAAQSDSSAREELSSSPSIEEALRIADEEAERQIADKDALLAEGKEGHRAKKDDVPGKRETARARVQRERAEQMLSVNDGTDLPLWQSYSDRLDERILDSMKNIFEYKHVTKVQASILDMMPIEKDLLIRSKTGTGKTLAFLTPALQRAYEEFDRRELTGTKLKKWATMNTTTLIISPTRELANQIATEARRLVTYQGSNMKALCLVGGDPKRDQLKIMRRERNDFIVATPGRLLDMLKNDHDVAPLMANLQTLILDEADTLLEMGFRNEMEEILQFIPKTRQTYMFSATVSKDVRQIARSYLKKDHLFLNTVGKDEQDSHMLIKQEYICRPAAEHMRTVLSLIISEQLKNENNKIMVFLQTTRMTMLYAAVFKTLRRLYPSSGFQQFDIHAQRSQDSRAKVSNAFRTANVGSLLFTTDVSARGVDYPGVTLVIQVGTPQTRDLYIHRLGRTGRAGKSGHGVLLMHEYEKDWVKNNLSDIPIEEKDFPDSEIALGIPQQSVFTLMKRLCPPAMIDDTYKAVAGAVLPRTRELRTTDEKILAEYTGWYRDLAGELSEPPEISMQRRGGRHDEGSDKFSNFGRAPPDFRSSRYNPRDRLPAGEPEWRPLRPTEQRRARKPQYDYNRYSLDSADERQSGPYSRGNDRGGHRPSEGGRNRWQGRGSKDSSSRRERPFYGTGDGGGARAAGPGKRPKW